MRTQIILWSIIAWAFCSCNQRGTEEYDPSSRYLYIPQLDEGWEHRLDTTYVTFKHHPHDEQIEVKFQVKLAGLALEEDREYRVRVVEKDPEGNVQTTALPEEYHVDTLQVFHAGQLEDSLKITLIKSQRLANTTVKLTVRLFPNETFGVGEYLGDYESRNATIASVTFDDKIAQPTWWTEEVAQNFLGEWTETKYLRFIDSCGDVLDLTGYEDWQIYELAVKFKNDIVKNQWLDDNGELIKLPIY